MKTPVPMIEPMISVVAAGSPMDCLSLAAGVVGAAPASADFCALTSLSFH